MDTKDIVAGARFTVLLGKNGAGKSTLLRALAKAAGSRYLTPERGGAVKYDSNVDNNMSGNKDWLPATRDRNRAEQFRQQSAALFRSLEVLVLRKIASDRNSPDSFDKLLKAINAMLPAINVVQADNGFAIESKQGARIDEEQISSGESELISLAIEVLAFSRSSGVDKTLFMDEPDVHLHPDLQQKFIAFVESTAVEQQFRVVIATHSTAVIAAFSETADLQIVPVTDRAQTEFSSFRSSAICRRILPIFGAHPLSSAFNLMPVLLVEGEDDKRVIEQVVRASKGALAWSPCPVGSADELNKWEKWLNEFLPALYDTPRAYSLRDLDSSPQSEIEDLGVVCRVRLNCYAMENILLTDECLAIHGFSPESFKAALSKWVIDSPHHQARQGIEELIERFTQRRILKIKDVRNVLVAVLESPKNWEVIVGGAITKAVCLGEAGENSVFAYLGEKATSKLFLPLRGS